MSKPALAHIVYFWLKEGTTEEDKKAFEKGLVLLGKIPLIQSFNWGTPAKAEKRDVVDDSFDYCINSFFATTEDEAAYQIDADHYVFINNHSHIWEKVIVYNNEVN